MSSKAAKTRSRAKTTTSAPKQRRDEFQATAFVTPASYPSSTTTFELSTHLIQPTPAFQHETSTNSHLPPRRGTSNHETSLLPPQVPLPVFTTIAIPTWPSLAEQQGLPDTAPLDDAMSSLMDELARWDENDSSESVPSLSTFTQSSNFSSVAIHLKALLAQPHLCCPENSLSLYPRPPTPCLSSRRHSYSPSCLGTLAPLPRHHRSLISTFPNTNSRTTLPRLRTPLPAPPVALRPTSAFTILALTPTSGNSSLTRQELRTTT